MEPPYSGSTRGRLHKLPQLTILGRSLLLLAGELLLNALCWIVAGLLFGRRNETHNVLNLCLLAWVGLSWEFLDESD